MPVTLSESPVAAESPTHKLWTRDECDMMQSAGVDLRRYELIEGELIQKVSKNYPHMRASFHFGKWLQTFFSEVILHEPSIFVSPGDSPTSEPEPDVVVLKRSIVEIGAKPQPDDISLIVEISDSSLAIDLGRKAGIYARAAIAEYWVLEVNGRRMIVHRDPQQGQYRSILVYREDEFVSCLAAPDRQILVADLL